ncbi:probable receptor-like serine/threonine-protein kinase At5g57670 [Cajanus cajan]|uniref:LRR receptor-like serine/threonine-protein kinase At1g56130 n=1 Tax=Cajanus cajan TaxID=3821 RepID=A0A151UBK0_CAJCA|nr:probable receptor-like serine/threonine-protein kinase At5g57670 [Cajanus cajan]KYP76695.1 putative LRR receptor-like serine/threonine-protein kinase At1g56130 [Cajanus cajan]
MKMQQFATAGEPSHGGSDARTVVVGVKMDSHSRELLTWALFKLAQPGDVVLALHVLGNDEIVNREGKSSLFSLVKAFESVLAVYEGFCDLKQVDLKLKICRGSSVKKILVREADACSATHILVGTPHGLSRIRPCISVAKYCAKKLPKDCWVLAVNNGKVVFKRDGSPATRADIKGLNHQDHKNGLLGTLSKSSQVLDVDGTVMNGKGGGQFSDHSLAKAFLDSKEFKGKKGCFICASTPALFDSTCKNSEEESCGEVEEKNPLAIVPVQTNGAASKAGWPLLHRKIVSDGKCPERSVLRQISVVQWAMQLPSRNISYTAHHDHKTYHFDRDKDRFSGLDSNCGALVPVNAEIGTVSLPEHNSRSIPKELVGLHEKYSSTCTLFKYQELVSATSNFLPENLIGKGGSSEVYRGCLPDGKQLAVKILKPSEEVLKEFVLEIEIITTLHHKNIISLLGFCFEDGNLLLVYDFLSRGSLEENLYGNKKIPLVFGWTERYKVAMGVAEALEYLHDNEGQSVIHRDVKSSNVLLSEDFEPQLSDFGLAKWASTSSSHIICTDVAGTFGYMAPEYFMYGKVTEKIDVYAFGVVLLELLSGRKPISGDYPKGQESLVMWASPILNSGKASQLLDPSLGDNYDHEEMERVVLAATLCIRRAPRARPQISLISKLLGGDADVIKWARLEVNATEAPEMLDDETCPPSILQSHLNLALLDVEDDLLSMCSVDQHVSLEDYLRGRWSRSSSFD